MITKPMKTRSSRHLAGIASSLLFAPAAFAIDADGTWTNASGGSWNTGTNWAANSIADGAGCTSDFITLDITANTTVTLDAARTIGNLVFGDTDTGTVGDWIIDTGTGGPLTLAGTAPTITVNPLGSKRVDIAAQLTGTDGFTKDGEGVLRLINGSSNISGPVVVSAGNLLLPVTALSSATTVAINGGSLISATGAANAIGGTISFGGGTLQYNNDPGTDYSAQFSTDPGQQYRINVISAGTPSTPRVVTYATNLSSDGGSLVKLAQGILILQAANTFNGTTTLSDGTLQLDDALALQNSALDTNASNAGTTERGIVLNGVTSPTFGGLIGNKALASLFNTSTGNYGLVTNVTLNPGTGADHAYSGVIGDGAAGMTLTKSGAGRQVLSAANTYTGGTVLNGGTLNYSNASALSSGPITYTGGTILQAGVATTLSNPIEVTGSITGTLGTAGFPTTASGPITGTGTLAKGGGGVLTLTGGLANTIAGGFRVASGRLDVVDGLSLSNAGPVTVLSGGTLNYSKNFDAGNNLTNDITLYGAGGGAFGALNLRGNVTATGSITLDADATISHDFNNATISGSITGTDHNLTLTTTESAQPGLVISGPIQLGTGGVTVATAGGSSPVTLSGSNTYSGETHVQTGKLVLSGDARIDDSATVRVESGAVLELAFVGTDAVGALFLPGDPNPKPAGTYGSLTSTADNKSADFEGDGILQVGAPANDYAAWAASQEPAITGGPDGDDDNDGVANLIEYALEDGGERGVFSGDTITFTKRGAPFGGDITYGIETSTDLGILDPWDTPASGVTEDAASISYTFTPGSPARNFARLRVLQTPP